MKNYDAEKNFDSLSERVSELESSSNERLLRLEDALRKMNDAIKRLELEINRKNYYFRTNLDIKNIKGTISDNLKNVGDIYNSKINKNKKNDK